MATLRTAANAEVKLSVRFPLRMAFCHTAMVDGYVVVGHVPPTDIKRLPKGHPEVKGLTVDTGTAQEIRMGVDGMTCGSFVAWVEQTIARRPGSRPPRPARRRRPLRVSHPGCYNQTEPLQPGAW
jgi:hypothetical protein